jgi:hypothetical protein
MNVEHRTLRAEFQTEPSALDVGCWALSVCFIRVLVLVFIFFGSLVTG